MSIDQRLDRIASELIEAGVPMKQAVDAFEAKYVHVGLRAFNGNQTRAARQLGIHRNTILNRLRAMKAMQKWGGAQ